MAHKKCSLFHFKLKQVHYKDNEHLLYSPWRRGMQRKWPHQLRRVPRFYKHALLPNLPFTEQLLCVSNKANFTNIIIITNIIQSIQVNGSLPTSFIRTSFLPLSYEVGQGMISIWHVKKVSLESLYKNCTRCWESQYLKVKPRLQVYRNAKPCLITIKSYSLFWSLQHTSKVSATILTLQMRKLRLREFKSLSEDIELINRKAGVQIQDHLTPKIKLFITTLHHLSFCWAVSSFIKGLCIKT